MEDLSLDSIAATFMDDGEKAETKREFTAAFNLLRTDAGLPPRSF
jgi:hypothetical protein